MTDSPGATQTKPTGVAAVAGSRRAALVDAAVELFAARPYDEVSIDDLVGAAGVAHGLVSYHFNGKRALFSAAVEQVSDEFLEYCQQPLSDEASRVDRTRAALRRHFEYVRLHPDRFRLLLPNGQIDPSLQTRLAQSRAAAFADSIGCPSEPPTVIGAGLRGWVVFLDGVTQAWYDDPRLELDDVVELCFQTLVSVVTIALGFRHDMPTVFAAIAQTDDWTS